MKHDVYRELWELNQHHRRMLEILHQLVEFFPELKNADFLLSELRLKKMQCETNVRALESIMNAELKECGQHEQEIARLEKEKDRKKDKSILRWMEGARKDE